MSQETVHASCVAIADQAVLIMGRSGSGKSDLALRLIDRGAALVSDDYTDCTSSEGSLIATPPRRIAGRIEVRGVGIVEIAHIPRAAVRLIVAIDEMPERMPEARSRKIAGIDIPWIALAALEPSAPIKVEQALRSVIEKDA